MLHFPSWTSASSAALPLLAAVVGSAVACREPTPAPIRPNWLILAPDTLRADRVDPRPGAVPEAPTLSTLARQGTHFVQTYSQGSWTAPALVSLLTGRYPQAGFGDRDADQWFPPRARRLPAIMALYDYRTVAFWGETLPSRFPTYSDGFDEVYTSAGIDGLGQDVVTWLEQAPPEPFFALVHDIDLHVVPPTGDLPGATWPLDIPDRSAGGDEVRATMLEWIRAGYRRRLAAHDGAVSRVLGALEARGLADHTVVVLISNHGEDLGEHWMLPDHGVLYDTVLHIPLVILDPDDPQAAREIRSPVQTIDLAPTILERSGIPLDRDMDGRSLLPILAGGEPDPEPRPLFALAGRGNAALRTEHDKIIACSPPSCPSERPCNASATEERRTSHGTLYFDLREDPEECFDRFGERSEQVWPQRETLMAWLAEHQPEGRPRGGSRYTTDQRRLLQDRGYWTLVEGADERDAGTPGASDPPAEPPEPSPGDGR